MATAVAALPALLHPGAPPAAGAARLQQSSVVVARPHFGLGSRIGAHKQRRNYTVHQTRLRTNANLAQVDSAAVDQQQLLDEVKRRLAIEQSTLRVGKNGRDDDDLILWFLKDRKYDVDATVAKLTKALVWRRNFGVDEITQETVSSIATTGKAYLHDKPDVQGRPVVVVKACKHYPAGRLVESEKLCVYLIEKALSQLPPDGEQILGIFDLRNFSSTNGDLRFVKFLVDVFFEYYPKRLAQVLFVDAPFIFQPGWNIVKPWLKSYAALVKFCSTAEAREKYFTPDTIPPDFLEASEKPSS